MTDVPTYIIVAMIPKFGPMPMLITKITGDPATDTNTAIINAAKLKYGDAAIKISCTSMVAIQPQKPTYTKYENKRIVVKNNLQSYCYYVACVIHSDTIFENCTFVACGKYTSYLNQIFVNCNFISQTRILFNANRRDVSNEYMYEYMRNANTD